MQEITTCPCCNGNSFIEKVSCKDYTVSKEIFTIKECSRCSFLITNPRPEIDELGNYYLSDKYISHSGKAKSLVDKIYLLVRNYTLKNKVSLINAYAETPGTLLDYGCGTGEFLNSCKNNSWNISGIEPSDSAREKATQLTRTTINSSLKNLNQTFDVITLWHVLEHVLLLNETLTHLKSLLKNNGTIFIAVPNHKSDDAEHYKQYWAGYDVPRHLWHFSPKTMNQIITSHSLNIVATIPMTFDSYYASMLSEKYKNQTSSIFGMIRAAFQGLISNIKANRTGNYSSLIYVIKK